MIDNPTSQRHQSLFQRKFNTISLFPEKVISPVLVSIHIPPPPHNLRISILPFIWVYLYNMFLVFTYQVVIIIQFILPKARGVKSICLSLCTFSSIVKLPAHFKKIIADRTLFNKEQSISTHFISISHVSKLEY